MTVVKTNKIRSQTRLILNTNEVHIWKVNLNQPNLQMRKLQMYLSKDELQRARRFFFEKDRNHFIVARAMLRKILSFYIKRQPYEFVFEYNRFGKPFLPSEFEGNKFRFNLSHSHGLALYAIALKSEVGIDIEYIRQDFDDLGIARRFFSPAEVSVLNSLPVEYQKEAFFLCWTRKEAFIKAKGKGLSIPLDQFDVSLTPGQPAQLLKTNYNRKDASRWSLFNLDIAPGYAAALALQGSQKWHLRLREWKD